MSRRDAERAEWLRNERYRAQVRETFKRLSDKALGYQDAVIRGGIDREECDREIARRRERLANACPTCRGTGGGQFNDCPTCDGNGVIA